jgi:hypothetical protein
VNRYYGRLIAIALVAWAAVIVLAIVTGCDDGPTRVQITEDIPSGEYSGPDDYRPGCEWMRDHPSLRDDDLVARYC